MIWGGTGWGSTCIRKTFPSGLSFLDGEFEKTLRISPPILKVRVQKDILKHFQSINDNPKSINLIGKASMQWFENYNGIGTARQWLSLLD